MAWAFDKFLDVDIPITEALLGFVSSSMKFFTEGGCVMCKAHALATTAGYGFDDNRKAYFFGNFECFFFVLDNTITAGNNGNPRFPCHVAGGGFVSHEANGGGFWPNELDVAQFALLGEVCILGEKPKARVNCIHVADFSSAQDAIGF